MDVFEGPVTNTVTATLKIPGISQDTISINMFDNRLTVSGEVASFFDDSASVLDPTLRVPSVHLTRCPDRHFVIPSSQSLQSEGPNSLPVRGRPSDFEADRASASLLNRFQHQVPAHQIPNQPLVRNTVALVFPISIILIIPVSY